MLELDLEGVKFELEIENYRNSTRENWDDEWCIVYVRVTSDVLRYNMHSSSMLCYEVEWIYQKLTELEEGEITDTINIENIEPDFEYILFPVNDGVYYMEWKFNLCNSGVLTANSFIITFDKEDIKKLKDYLLTIINR